jgi:hypothetical protein
MGDGQIIAIIGGVFSIIVVLVQGVTMWLVDKGNKDNARDHGIVQSKLDGLNSKIQDIKIDVVDIKSDVKHLDTCIDKLREDFDGHLNGPHHRAAGKTRKSSKSKTGV